MDLQPNGMALALDDLGRNQLSVTQSTLEMRRKETVQDWTSATGSKKNVETPLALGYSEDTCVVLVSMGTPLVPQ